MWTTNFYKSFSKKILLYMSSRLSKIRSEHTYVMPRTVYFGWICMTTMKLISWPLKPCVSFTAGTFFASFETFLARFNILHNNNNNHNNKALFRTYKQAFKRIIGPCFQLIFCFILVLIVNIFCIIENIWGFFMIITKLQQKASVWTSKRCSR